MCNVLILDDTPDHLRWLVGIVKATLKSFGKFKLLPLALNEAQTAMLQIPQRPTSCANSERVAWADKMLSAVDVSDVNKVDIAIVDLCLTVPTQLGDPEGMWVCAALRKRFPECYIILVSNKTTIESPDIAGGWFKRVQVPTVRIDEVIGIRDDDPVSSRSQLESAIRKRVVSSNLIAS